MEERKITSKEEALKIIAENPKCMGNLRLLSEDLRDDIDVLNAAIKYECLLLSDVSDRKKNDKNFVLSVIRQTYPSSGRALECISEELRNDKDVVLAALLAPLHDDIALLGYVSEELRSDKDVVLAAVRTDGINLCYASEELRSDKGVVETAVKSHRGAFKYASEDLRGDDRIAYFAINSRRGRYDSVLEFASEELRGDKALVMNAVSVKGGELKFASEALQSDREIAETAIKTNPYSIEYVNSEIIDSDLIELAWESYRQKEEKDAKYAELYGDYGHYYDENNEEYDTIMSVQEKYNERMKTSKQKSEISMEDIKRAVNEHTKEGDIKDR